MKVGGKITKSMVKVDLFMLMETSMMENGKTIRFMVMGFTLTLMVVSNKGIGKMISNMARV
jgi:hypothetical protein